MKTKTYNKITKTIISEILVWSQKANGIPKQEIIDQITTGLTRGWIKTKGEQVTEHEYLDKGSDTRFIVNFAQKTIKVTVKDVEKAEHSFKIEAEPVKETKAPKAPKAEKPVKEPKLSKKGFKKSSPYGKTTPGR